MPSGLALPQSSCGKPISARADDSPRASDEQSSGDAGRCAKSENFRRKAAFGNVELIAAAAWELVGWANYFSVGAVTKAYGMVKHHVTNRLRRWLCAKHRVRGPGYSRYPDAFLYQKLGLYQLGRTRPSLPNASV